MSVSDPFTRFYKIKHNSAIACQIQLDSLDKRVNANFSWQAKTFGYQIDTFGPRFLIAKGPTSLIDQQNFNIANCISTWIFTV